MRVTNNMISQNLLRNLQTSQEKIQQMQDQASSGLRINKPSDDPVGIQNVMRLKNNISSVEQWKSNADAALGDMNMADGTLGDMTSMLQRVKDLAVQGSNETLSADDRKTVATEVDQLTKQIKIMANTQIGSKYIFSGTATDQELIPTDGSPLSGSKANGDNVTLEIGNQVSIPIYVIGQTLFGISAAEPNGLVPKGLLDTLDKLSAGLTTNDTTAITASLDDLDTNINNVINQRAGLGASMNRVTAVQSQLDSTSLNLQKSLSDVQSVDMAKAITDFTSQQTTYKAALSVGAQILQISLVDYIK